MLVAEAACACNANIQEQQTLFVFANCTKRTVTDVNNDCLPFDMSCQPSH